MAASSEMPGPGRLEILLNMPAVPPPAGIIPNLDNPPSIDTICYTTFSLCLSLASLAVGIRLYTKRFVICCIAYEDYSCMIGLVGLWGFFVPSLLAQISGAGVHAWSHWFDTAVIVYVAEVFFVKLSILLLYLRIFVPDRKANFTMFVAVQGCIWVLFSFSAIYLFLNIFMCNPREKLWNPLVNTGHCFNSGMFSSEGSGIFNVVSDFVILMLPMPCLSNLQMRTRKKIWMMAIFATGFFVCMTSIVRTYYSFQVLRSTDKIHNLELMGLWGWAEIATGIIVSCLPIMPRFIQHVGPKIYKTVSLRSKHKFGNAHVMQATHGIPKTKAFTKIQRRPAECGASGTSELLADPHHTPPWLDGESLPTVTFDLSLPSTITAIEPTRPPGVILATRRDDLEYGQRASPD